MEQIISQVLLTWGPVGVIVIAASWVLYNHLKEDWREKSDKLPTDVSTFVRQIDTSLNAISDKVDLVNEKIEMVNDRVDDIDNKFEERSDLLEKQIGLQSAQFIKDMEILEKKKRDEHNKQMNDLLILGPKLHTILLEFIYKTNSDHIFLGSFHNGSNSISGIPYYKFDIIAERFLQKEHAWNRELAPLYKDVDILRHNKLPGMLINQKLLYFNKNNINKLCEIDNILYQKILEQNATLLAVNILIDKSGLPSGFVGCLRFDNDENIDLNKLTLCADTLEGIYQVNENN